MMAACRSFFSRIINRTTTPSSVRGFVRPYTVGEVNEEFSVRLLDGENKGTCLFVLNKPQTKNAISVSFVDKLEECLHTVRHNNEIRTLILKSNVPRTFCAGADLKERLKMKESEVAPKVARMRSVVTALSELPVAVIAAMDGLAYGGGLEIALACDIRIAANDAKMGLVETRLAIIPGGGGTQRLPRLVGIGKAKELIFTAKVLTGAEAFDIGLVEHAVEQNDEGNAAFLKSLEIAKEIGTKSPISIASAKHAIHFGMQADIATGLKVEEACYSQTLKTEDRIEGLKAFAEKRAPVYKGR